jgi:hypothetical protein
MAPRVLRSYMRTLCEKLETTWTHLGAAEGQAWTHSSRMDEQDPLKNFLNF